MKETPITRIQCKETVWSNPTDALAFFTKRVSFLDRNGVKQGRNPYDSRILWFGVTPPTKLLIGTTLETRLL